MDSSEKTCPLLSQFPNLIRTRPLIAREHAARFAYDMGRIIDDLQAGQEKHVAEGWKLIKVPTTPHAHPDSALRRSRFARRQP